MAHVSVSVCVRVCLSERPSAPENALRMYSAMTPLRLAGRHHDWLKIAFECGKNG